MKIKYDFECAKCPKFICMQTIYADKGDKQPVMKLCSEIANEAPEWKLVKKTRVKG